MKNSLKLVVAVGLLTSVASVYALVELFKADRAKHDYDNVASFETKKSHPLLKEARNFMKLAEYKHWNDTGNDIELPTFRGMWQGCYINEWNYDTGLLRTECFNFDGNAISGTVANVYDCFNQGKEPVACKSGILQCVSAGKGALEGGCIDGEAGMKFNPQQEFDPNAAWVYPE